MTKKLEAYLDQEVMAADPVELVCMIYQAAITEVREARRNLAIGNITARCTAISRACDFVSELLSSLNMEAGGDLSARLSGLYSYSLNRLVEANLTKSDPLLAEVLGLLLTLQEGWKTIVAEKRRPVVTPCHLLQEHAADPVPQSWSF